MKSSKMIDEILKYHRKKRKKERLFNGGYFDYHSSPDTDWVGCDSKCSAMLKELEYQKLKETVKG